MNFEMFQKDCLKRIENYLDKLLSLENPLCQSIPHLYEALRYAVLNGGKRLRPLLVYATGEALGHPLEFLDAPAAAVELIHCYSLVHDDLPALDNDDLRRGKPTCHKAFGEATAILTGDALQTLAFQLLSDPLLNPISPVNKLSMINLLAKKSGLEGMVGGQSLDLAATGKTLFLTIGELKDIHQKKTGALIEAAVALGALASEHPLSEHKMALLEEYARCIGLAFQIQDDILDIESNTETLGKSAGKDEKQKKTTYPSKLGVETAKQYAHTLHLQALEAIVFLQDKAQRLAELSFLMVNRSN